ncbi:FMN reductase [Aureimonas phyllosphaerae]|uniref:FMN reductase n=1 Tax=Aureimonas phyllosphaerae TaxID=1166078 RepID=A0A7W6BVW6_9HYPH|nr:FMN reductase [Aureimonas phyllosphaerae]MBB3937044.1 FMN reductase [Aureimonas phyllosphaerae]MBB3960841.1 FMN reductase [Aureimonas phyllosphaerae]SFF49778.1 FMN reductase [Aureimonas phyllosphaerae]
MTVRILGISGSVRRPSRTTTLVAQLTDRIARALGGTGEVIELVDAAPHLFSALERDALGETGRDLIQRIETADALVVGTPVYRASYTGALKHLFDLVDHRALSGRPVVLAATGGSTLHGLVTEHQLRPLLSFFGALTLPTTLYATEADFESFALTDPAIAARVERAAREAAQLIAAQRRAPTAVPAPIAIGG